MSFKQECIEFLKKYDKGELSFKHNVLEHILNEHCSYEEIDYAIKSFKNNSRVC